MIKGNDPPANVPPMEIQLIDETKVDSHRVPARTFAPLQQRFLNEHVEFLLRIGVIKKSKSNITSPIVLVRKPDKSWRMCIDLRWVNSHTTTMRWPLPKLQEILPYLNESKFFASLDLLRGDFGSSRSRKKVNGFGHL